MKHFSEGVTAILDFQRDLGAEVRARISTAIGAYRGVSRAEFSSFVPRVMLVQYDSAAISAAAIRNAVQAHLKIPGPAARLVGM
jgi:hypothetical protein